MQLDIYEVFLLKNQYILIDSIYKLFPINLNYFEYLPLKFFFFGELFLDWMQSVP